MKKSQTEESKQVNCYLSISLLNYHFTCTVACINRFFPKSLLIIFSVKKINDKYN